MSEGRHRALPDTAAARRDAPVSAASHPPLSGAAAARIVAGVTLTRMRRSRSLWVAAVVALLPAAAALVVPGGLHGAEAWHRGFDMCQGVLAIIPPLLMAQAIGEEFEQHTFTYLWSRPFPRPAVVIGKAMAGLPLALALVTGAAALAFFAAMGARAGVEAGALTRGAGALAVGAVAVSALSMGLGGLVHRHALATTVIYMLVLDVGVGAMPFSIRKLSLSYHVRELSGVPMMSVESASAAIAWLVGMAAVWSAIAVWRAGATEPPA